MARWRDVAGVTAAGLEGAAVAAALRGDGPLALAMHAASCGGIALGLSRRLLDGPTASTVVFCVALFLPVVGALGLVTAALLAPAPAIAPEPDLVYTHIPGAAEVPAVAAPARAPAGPPAAAARVAALRGRGDPPPIAMLRRALDDLDDDVRLVAHALLESKSRAAYRSIHDTAAELEAAPPAQRGAIHRRLAAEHWELAWLGLAQGECLDHALEMARRHALAALDADPRRASLHFLLGRIELRRGEAESAEAALGRAVRLGLSADVAQPYLAEAAFVARRFERVRRRLGDAVPAAAAVDRVRRYWS